MAMAWKGVALATGILAVLLGIVWIGRGSGVLVTPPHSFMAGEMQWAWRGLALSAIGGLIVFISRRIW